MADSQGVLIFRLSEKCKNTDERLNSLLDVEVLMGNSLFIRNVVGLFMHRAFCDKWTMMTEFS
jgi:hypothetical protein